MPKGGCQTFTGCQKNIKRRKTSPQRTFGSGSAGPLSLEFANTYAWTVPCFNIILNLPVGAYPPTAGYVSIYGSTLGLNIISRHM